MAGVNRVFLIGHVGRDAEVRYTQGGTAVANFSLATSESFGGRDGGERQERTEWHNIVVWARQAEIAGQYVRKGRQLFVEGRLQTRSWEQDGVTRYTTEIVVNDMQMLDSKGAGGGTSYNNQSTYSNPPSAPQAQSSNSGGMQQGPPADFDDDIPF